MMHTSETKQRRAERGSWTATLCCLVGLVACAILTVPGSAAERLPSLSLDLQALLRQPFSGPTRVIVPGSPEATEALAVKYRLRIIRRVTGAVVVSATRDQLAALSRDTSIASLSGDLSVRPGMAVSAQTIGADQVVAGSGGLAGLGSVPGVTGAGIVVAVVDSGITPHPALAGKIVASVSMLAGDPSTTDAFGHGTHVAGIIAGAVKSGSAVTPFYLGGVAPGAKVVNVRVLGAEGFGYTSDVIAGIDWVIANRDRYGIRIINLSLGHPVTEPAVSDPLCQAVARAHAAGLVVVVAAGNAGLTADGRPVLGGILSPGNAPMAITVGATNTWGTASRSDDTVGTYSSHGPSPIDLTVKPDLAAPGTRIVSLEAEGSYLASTYPQLHRAGNRGNAFMQLTGTSMAAPMVSGAAALLLDGQSALSPSQLKLLLQAGATYLKDGGIMGAGAGSINVLTSRKLAANGTTQLASRALGAALGTAGMTFWDAGTLADRIYSGPGVRLINVLDLSGVVRQPSLLKVGDLNLLGLANPLATMPPNQLLYGQVASLASHDQILWGTTLYNAQGQQILWGTNDQILWGTNDQILWGTTLTDEDAR